MAGLSKIFRSTILIFILFLSLNSYAGLGGFFDSIGNGFKKLGHSIASTVQEPFNAITHEAKKLFHSGTNPNPEQNFFISEEYQTAMMVPAVVNKCGHMSNGKQKIKCMYTILQYTEEGAAMEAYFGRRTLLSITQ